MTAKRLMLVQFAGDYRDAWRRQREGQGETYYGHGYVLEQLRRFTGEAEAVAMLCALSPEAYKEELPDGITLMAAAAHPRRDARRLLTMIQEWGPTHLIVLGPMPRVIRWGLKRGLKLFCLFADSFETSAVYRFLKYGRLGALLDSPGVDWVANHGRNACESLARIGVRRSKIVPWDWPQRRTPEAQPPRTASGATVPTALFVGLIHRQKGIGDAIDAIAILRRQGRDVRLRVAGAGAVDQFRAHAEKAGVADLIDFLGLVPNDRVFEMMREVDMVLVPSRHGYPEGLPLTIYESLCARTPIVASDHPMFAGHLVEGESASVFRAARADDFAAAIARLLDRPDLYARYSADAPATWARMQQRVLWGELIHRWLRGDADDVAWIDSNTISATA